MYSVPSLFEQIPIFDKKWENLTENDFHFFKQL